MSRFFLVMIGLALGLLALGRAFHSESPKPAGVIQQQGAAPVPAVRPKVPEARATPTPPAKIAAPATQAPSVGVSAPSRTPTIDRLVRLEAKRRLAQSERFTYLDSALVTPDSMIRRWGDKDGSPVLVAIVLPAQPGAARLTARILAAANQWASLGLGVRFAETPDTARADVVVQWTEHFEKDRTGQADMQSGSDGIFVAGRVTIALKDRTNRVLTDSEIEMIATHEFGHVIGLPHSSNRSDVMFPTTTVNRPSDRDRATAVLLYSLPPGSLREP